VTAKDVNREPTWPSAPRETATRCGDVIEQSSRTHHQVLSARNILNDANHARQAAHAQLDEAPRAPQLSQTRLSPKRDE
jgi:hypothetical protein